jgi:hypothetical protein
LHSHHLQRVQFSFCLGVGQQQNSRPLTSAPLILTSANIATDHTRSVRAVALHVHTGAASKAAAVLVFVASSAKQLGRKNRAIRP